MIYKVIYHFSTSPTTSVNLPLPGFPGPAPLPQSATLTGTLFLRLAVEIWISCFLVLLPLWFGCLVVPLLYTTDVPQFIPLTPTPIASQLSYLPLSISSQSVAF